MMKALYAIYGLPSSYHEVTYSDTKLPKGRIEDLKKKVDNAPSKGTLTIQGTAAPIVNQLLEQGRKVRGIDFVSRSSSAFDQHVNPTCDVIVIYGVGNEVTLNAKVSSLVLSRLLKRYKDTTTLVIIETDYTKSQLLNTYDFDAVNFIKIQPKDEETWI